MYNKIDYDALQPHFGPHLQASPHWHADWGFGWEAWQPHLQVVPGQDAHLQTFEFFDMENLLGKFVFDCCQHEKFPMRGHRLN